MRVRHQRRRSTKRYFTHTQTHKHTHNNEVVITGGRWREERNLTSFMLILGFGIGFIFDYIVGMPGMSRYPKLSNTQEPLKQCLSQPFSRLGTKENKLGQTYYTRQLAFFQTQYASLYTSDFRCMLFSLTRSSPTHPPSDCSNATATSPRSYYSCHS